MQRAFLLTLGFIALSPPLHGADDSSRAKGEYEITRLRGLLKTVTAERDNSKAYAADLEIASSALLRALRKNPTSAKATEKRAILEALLRKHNSHWEFYEDTSSGDEHLDTDSNGFETASPLTASPDPSTARTSPTVPGAHSVSDGVPHPSQRRSARQDTPSEGSMSSADY